jgi:hypothetical protein
MTFETGRFRQPGPRTYVERRTKANSRHLLWVISIHPGTTETEMGDQVLVMRARNLGTNDIDEAPRSVTPL